MKILVVFGTRPEAIKMAPLIQTLRLSNVHDVKVCLTGQHREMVSDVLPFFGIANDYNLDIMKTGQDLFDVTISVLEKLKTLLFQFVPDLIIVHGDTTSAMAASLAGFYLKIKVAHVEAGLRTFNTFAPYPEELNRQLITRIATYHFAPTNTSKQNLIDEGVPKKNIVLTGNTVVDALMWAVKTIRSDTELRERTIKNLNGIFGEDWQSLKIVLVTGHRRENFGTGFENICIAISRLAKCYPEIIFVYPVHFNPQVRNCVLTRLSGISNIKLIEPLGYVSFVLVLQKCYMVLTDSGGIQEEAPSLGKPVLVMRDVTERPEGVAAGTVKLVGTNIDEITSNVIKLIENRNLYEMMAQARNPYGDGSAAKKIAEFINALS